MNILPIEKRVQIINLLVEGMSMRAISRVADVSINTVTKLLEDVGKACAMYQDETIHSLSCKRVQCDEIWGFCYSKGKNVAPENRGLLGHGDVYTWTGIDIDTKLVVSYALGKRDADYANAFMQDLASRLSNRVQLNTDGHKPYLQAVENTLHGGIDYAMLVKHYGPGSSADLPRYNHSEFVSVEPRKINGNLGINKISRSYVERQNLTLRMTMLNQTSLTNGFAKRVQNLVHAASLHFMHYNFARIHKTLRVTPAIKAGFSDHVWRLEEIAALVSKPEPKKRGHYKPRKTAISS
jgi:hypothetical protein